MGNLCSKHIYQKPRSRIIVSSSYSTTISNSNLKAAASTPAKISHTSNTHYKPPEKISSGPQGLPNLGNTCFANAALQCILSTEALKLHLTQNSTVYNKFSQELKSIFQSNSNFSQSNLDPSTLLSLVWTKSKVFRPGEQNDAHEFVVFLLDQLHEELKKPYKNENTSNPTKAEKSWLKYLEKNYSLISQEFQGQLKTTLVCQSCQKNKERFDPFMYLSLSIPQEHGCSIGKCLELFQSDDLLEGSNRWYCKNCKNHENTVKKTEIIRVSNHIIIHLKRFKDANRKNCNLVGYSERLEIAVDGKNIEYELYAKIKHMGGLSGGHYVAVAKQNGTWYSFNDNSVERTGFSPSAETYLLFYKMIHVY